MVTLYHVRVLIDRALTAEEMFTLREGPTGMVIINTTLNPLERNNAREEGLGSPVFRGYLAALVTAEDHTEALAMLCDPVRKLLDVAGIQACSSRVVSPGEGSAERRIYP